MDVIAQNGIHHIMARMRPSIRPQMATATALAAPKKTENTEVMLSIW